MRTSLMGEYLLTFFRRNRFFAGGKNLIASPEKIDRENYLLGYYFANGRRGFVAHRIWGKYIKSYPNRSETKEGGLLVQFTS